MNLLATVLDWFVDWGWIVLVIAAVMLVVAVVWLCVCKHRAKAKKSEQARLDDADVKEVVQNAEQEKTAVQTDKSETEAEKPEEKAEEESAPEEAGQDEEIEPESAEQEAAVADGANKDDEQQVKKTVSKTYHIGKRKSDGKWQVKMAGGAKAIKLFATQLEAINYAKKLAESQEAKIVIHKEDGTFRRMTYNKKKTEK